MDIKPRKIRAIETKPRRDRGEGTIEPLGSNHYRGRLSKIIDGKREMSPWFYGNKTEVKNAITDWKLNFGLKSLNHSKELVGVFFDSWFHFKSTNGLKAWAESTADTNGYVSNKYIKSNAEFCNLKLREVSFKDVQKFMDSLVCSENSKVEVLKLVTAAFDYAFRKELIQGNPFKRILKEDRPMKARTERLPFAESDEALMYRYAFSPDCTPLWKAVILLGFDTGAEPQEFLALQVQDLNELHLEVSFQRTLTVTRSGLKFSSLMKTERKGKPRTKRNRHLVVNQDTWNALAALLGPNVGRESSLLTPDGKPWHYDRFLDAWHKTLKAVSVSRSYVPLSMRHSMATNMINVNQPIADVSERLGHENITTTIENYYHANKNHRKALAQSTGDRMKRLLSPSMSGGVQNVEPGIEPKIAKTA